MRVIKNQKVYFLILILIFLFFFTYVIYNTKSIIKENKNRQGIQIKIQIERNLVDELIFDIYKDVDDGASRQATTDKVFTLVEKAKSLINKNETQTYLDLGKAYEIGALLGMDNASDLALQTYNEYCKLEPNNPDCYTTLAKFLLLDKSRKKESLALVKIALTLSRSEEETKSISELFAYIENLKP